MPTMTAEEIAIRARLEQMGSLKDSLKEQVLETDHPAKVVYEPSQAQMNWGKLIGELATLPSSSTYEDIEQVFKDWEAQYGTGDPLTYIEKIVSFFHSIATLSIDERGYRAVRKVYLAALRSLGGY